MQRALLLVLCALSMPMAAGHAQQTFSSSTALVSGSLPQDGGQSAQLVAQPILRSRPFSALAIGAKVGILGVGFETATPLARNFNLRGGANFFSYSDNFSSDGVNYGGNLRFRSAEASVDWFPWAKGFHVSPGALVYNGNRITGTANVPGGDTFTLNSVTYMSDPADPVTGTGGVTFAKAAPKLTVGWGNMLPRSGRHFSVPFEAGAAYVGDPKVALNLSGSVCDPGGLDCSPVAADPSVEANIAAQQQKYRNDLAPARFFPILSIGFSYAF